MRLLYVSSCHPTLEYNDLTLFSEMGIDCVSTGIYANPNKPFPHLVWRHKSIPGMKYDQEAADLFKISNPRYYHTLKGYFRPRLIIPKSLAEKFDVIMCNSFTHYVDDNWNNIKDQVVIWKTYGDSTAAQEKSMKEKVIQGLKIIRGSENELKKPESAGGEVIRCHIDSDYYSGWRGTEPCVLSFQNAFVHRQAELAGQEYLRLRALSNAKFRLFGDHSSKHNLVEAFLPFSNQLQQYQVNQIYFSIGSHPAPITYNFMEALTVGMPLITFGYKIGQAPMNGIPSYYQAPEFIEHGVSGFVSDDVLEISSIIKELLASESLRNSISNKARSSAIGFWGKEVIKNKWKDYFKSQGLII